MPLITPYADSEAILDLMMCEDATFDLMYRQEISRTAGGVTLTKDLGPPLWMATYTSSDMSWPDVLRAQAALNRLDGSLNAFAGYDVRHPYPTNAPVGNFTDSSTLMWISADRGRIKLENHPPGLGLVARDYLSFDLGTDTELHQVVSDGGTDYDHDGLTGVFEVRPRIRPGAVIGTPVRLKKPHAAMIVMPGSVSATKRSRMTGSIAFSAVQVFD
jgi:hypothetical protein